MAASAASLASTQTALYSLPRGSPSARLLMRGVMQPGEQFLVNVLDDAVQCKTPRRVGTGTAQKQPDAAQLAAGVLTTLDFVVIKAQRQRCLVRWTFTPVAGRSYALQGNSSATGCGAALIDVTQPDQLRPADGALRRNMGAEVCLPLSRSAPAPRSPLEGGQSGGDAVLNPGATTADLEGLIRP
jgi:hypothetical protein